MEWQGHRLEPPHGGPDPGRWQVHISLEPTWRGGSTCCTERPPFALQSGKR